MAGKTIDIRQVASFFTTASPIHRAVAKFKSLTAKQDDQLIALQREAYRLGLLSPIDPNLVVYEAYAGKGVLCNPEGIFRHLLQASDMQHLTHTWVLDDMSQHREARSEFRDDPRVQFVEFRSLEYFRVLATAMYLFNNVTFPPEFSKRPDQVYVNTWHGVPIKRLGFDIPGGAYFTRNVIRNFLNCDYVLSSAPYMTSELYLKAERLLNIYEGKILEVGTPRIDQQIARRDQREQMRATLVANGVHVKPDFKVILYAPTWRGNSILKPTDDAASLLDTITTLNRLLESQKIQVVLKPHQTVASRLKGIREAKGLVVPNELPTNAVLAAADGLITDYSSIYFDYLVERRPTFFYVPDLDLYHTTQGLLLDHAELAGSVSNNVITLGSQIAEAFGEKMGLVDPQAWATDIEKFAPYEDGAASERVVDAVFRGRSMAEREIVAPKDGRIPILLYLGALHSNGITNSAINLTKHIDHEKFDVTVMYVAPSKQDRPNADRFPREVRMLERVGGINVTRREKLEWETLLFKKPGLLLALDSMADIARNEWHRCFGSAQFDYIVDFQGYSPFWSVILQQGQAKQRSIWQHNDLLLESKKVVKGRKLHARSLGALFQLYSHYDHIVSVSSALAEINGRNLARYALPSHFGYAANVIDQHQILRDAGLMPAARLGPADAVDAVLVEGRSVKEDFERLASIYSTDELMLGANQQQVIERWIQPALDRFTFVTIGRLSPEKNQERLIRAFSEVHRENPQTQLVIIGDGPLRESLEQLIRELNLSAAVRLTGHLAAPHRVVAACDCFALSSDHEGQPLVILEALVLGIPVVSTDFESVRGALAAGQGLVVPRDVDGLVGGLRAALNDEVPRGKFDAAEYNDQALEQFYLAIGIRTSE